MKIGIFTRYNDTDNIIEFMKYHYSIGINYILIYNDGSSNKLDECKNHFPKNMFNIVYFRWIEKNDIHTLNYSRSFYKSILKILKRKNVDYCFHIDNDEYIVLQQFNNNVHELVNHYKPFDQVYFNWIYFGDNNIYDASNLSTLLDKNNKSEMYVSSDEPKVLVNVKTAISASSPHFFDRFNKDKQTINKDKQTINKDKQTINKDKQTINKEKHSIINKNVFNESNVPIQNRYKPIGDININDLPIYIAHFSIITLKDFYKKRFNHISGSRLAKPNFKSINFKSGVKNNYILIYLLTILKIKKEDFIKMISPDNNLNAIIEPFYTMIDLYLRRNKNNGTNTIFNKFINDNPNLYINSQKNIINITKDIIIKMIIKVKIKNTLTTEAINILLSTVKNSTMEEIIVYGLYTPASGLYTPVSGLYTSASVPNRILSSCQ